MQPGMDVGKPIGVGKQWNASGSWGEEDDGGWSQGPPASGSGWMGGTAAANGANRDMENWGQNSHDQFIDWQRQQPPNIIVDRNDKEAWPSIGGSNHSETASDHDDDNASGKSGSVISVSSNHGQSQGQEVNTSGSSAIQGQSASSLWSGGNSSFNGVESNTWGVGLGSAPSSSAAMGWGSSNPSLSMNNQGHNMQSITSMAGNGSDLSNSLSFSSRMSAGWGAPGSLPQGQNQSQGGNRPQNSVQIPQSSVTGSNVGGNNMQGAVPGSGAPSQQQNGPQMSTAVSQLGPINNPSSVQQGNSAFQSVGFPRSTADSAWGSTSSGASPIGANNIGSDAAANAGKGNSGNNGQVKSGDSNAGGWGVLPNTSEAANKSTSGWPTGNPSSTSSDWGNPPPSNSQWGSPVTPSSQQGAPQWPGGQPTSASNSNQPRSQTTWAQAATKGLPPNNNPNSNTASNQSATAGGVPSATSEKDREIIKAIESHEGWGQKPVRQDTAWDQIQTSPKTQRKFSSSSTEKANSNNNNTNNSNMWNNNNGTAIWESNKEPTPGAWNSATPSQRPGSQWEGGDNRDSWNGPPKQAEAAGGAPWGGSAASGAGNNEGQSSEWGGKTETGSWPGAGDDTSGGISTWGEDNQNPGWDGSQGNSNRSGTDGTYVWGEPQKPPQNWNGPPNQNAPPPMARGVRPQSSSGWGDPGSPNMGGKVDDGTSHWGGGGGGVNQRPPSSFGEPGQWNPAVGPMKPKPSTSSSSSWGEEWNPSADPRKGFNKFPGGNQPQMRSRMLQQLMEIGFQKDEAQHALISNNMNYQNALADLYKQKGANIVKRDYDMDVFHDGAKPKMPGMDIGATDNIDISADTQLDSNPYVPNNSMQNTPFQNAQIPNQFNYKGPSLPPSSQQNNNVSIMPQQQRIIQEKFKQQQQPNSSIPPPPLQSTQGIVGRGQILPTTAVQQQMAQQQILQQLHLAVKAGLISPQLLNQQLPPPMLVMLQQLLQHQQCLQQLITTQQLIQQNKMGQNPVLQQRQLEQVAMKINAIKQQILTYQRQISDAQRVLIKQQSSNLQPPQEMDPISSLPTDMANLNITNQTSQPQTQQQPQPLQSKLSQWKRSSEKETNNNVTTPENGSVELNKAVGSKPGIPQSRSTPNLEFGLGLTNLGGDSTWSNSPTTTSASQNWPSSIGTSSSNESTKDSSVSDGKESQDSPVTTSSTSVLLNDSIPEFVPGKPWQGISTKSVEDDPHITPGSFSLTRSFSVSTVKENDLVSLTKPIPSASESPSWSTNPNKNVSQKWSGDNSIPTSFSNEVWGVPIPKNTSRPPPGLIPNNKTIGSGNTGGWSGGINRQHSWAGPKTDNSAFSAAGNSGWDSRMPNNVSTCLILRNLTPQIDGSTLRTLCLQHGPLMWFYLSLNHGQALVRYNSREEAMKAQKSLNTCVLGNTTIVAEFVSDAEASRFVEQSPIPAQPTSQWSQQQNSLSYRQSNRNEGSWSSSQTQVPVAPGYPANMWTSNSGGGLWGGSGVDEHNALLGNMLGESM